MTIQEVLKDVEAAVDEDIKTGAFYYHPAITEDGRAFVSEANKFLKELKVAGLSFKLRKKGNPLSFLYKKTFEVDTELAISVEGTHKKSDFIVKDYNSINTAVIDCMRRYFVDKIDNLTKPEEVVECTDKMAAAFRDYLVQSEAFKKRTALLYMAHKNGRANLQVSNNYKNWIYLNRKWLEAMGDYTKALKPGDPVFYKEGKKYKKGIVSENKGWNLHYLEENGVPAAQGMFASKVWEIYVETLPEYQRIVKKIQKAYKDFKQAD